MLRSFIEGLTGIAFPKICLVCKSSLGTSSVAGLICSRCWSKVQKNLPPFCRSCGRHLDKNNFTNNICLHCLKVKLHFDRAFSPCVYNGVIKELLHMFKYSNKKHLGLPLSSIMADFIKEYNLPIGYLDLIIPMPLHKTRLREREFNQAQILGNYIAREFKKDLCCDTLARRRNTKTQTHLSLDERALNVKDCFSVTEKTRVKGKNILLVDDVLTSGATCSEAACVLKNEGASIIFVLTLAN